MDEQALIADEPDHNALDDDDEQHATALQIRGVDNAASIKRPTRLLCFRAEAPRYFRTPAGNKNATYATSRLGVSNPNFVFYVAAPKYI